MKKWNEINNYLAVKMTLIFGSMNTFWILFIGVLIPLILEFAFTMSTIQFISSGIIQLIALPLILVGQNILNQEAEKRSTLTRNLSDERQLADHKILQEQTELIRSILEEINCLKADLKEKNRAKIED